LRVVNGDVTITKDGTVLDGVDLRGSVSVKANNVTIKRSIIRGNGQGAQPGKTKALVMSWWGYKNLKVQDSTLSASTVFLTVDGISGKDFLAERLDISRVVDPVKVIGGNVTVTGSWLHDTAYSASDPNQSDGRTHDDGVQIEGGGNISISGNTIEGSHNSAIMVTQNYSVTSTVKVSGNWLKDGACTVNVSQLPRSTAIQGMEIKNNFFGPGKYGTTCPMRLPNSSPITLSANVWESNGTAAKPVRF
jgi:hypothetical protein